jgi:hypothetical protein
VAERTYERVYPLIELGIDRASGNQRRAEREGRKPLDADNIRDFEYNLRLAKKVLRPLLHHQSTGDQFGYHILRGWYAIREQRNASSRSRKSALVKFEAQEKIRGSLIRFRVMQALIVASIVNAGSVPEDSPTRASRTGDRIVALVNPQKQFERTRSRVRNIQLVGPSLDRPRQLRSTQARRPGARARLENVAHRPGRNSRRPHMPWKNGLAPSPPRPSRRVSARNAGRRHSGHRTLVLQLVRTARAGGGVHRHQGPRRCDRRHRCARAARPAGTARPPGPRGATLCRNGHLPASLRIVYGAVESPLESVVRAVGIRVWTALITEVSGYISPGLNGNSGITSTNNRRSSSLRCSHNAVR